MRRTARIEAKASLPKHSSQRPDGPSTAASTGHELKHSMQNRASYRVALKAPFTGKASAGARRSMLMGGTTCTFTDASPR